MGSPNPDPAAVTDVNDPLFWKLQNIEDEYWFDYIASRPIYDQKFMGRIFDYHSEHSSLFRTAIDIGAGPGLAAESLLPRFNHVIASDNDPRSLGVGMRRLSDVPAEKLSWLLSTGEDILKHHGPESMDLITVAGCFPLMDTQTVLQNFHTILSPGGTLAIWFYGRIHFTEAAYADKCQPILDRIMDLNFKRIVSGCGPERQLTWKRAANGMASWLDYVPFTPTMWQDVRRHKWNPDFFLPFFGPGACDFEWQPFSSVGDHETITSEKNPELWKVDWDIAGVRRFVAAAFPIPKDLLGETVQMEELFAELGRAMDGSKRAFSWPAVLILATKG